MWVESKKTPNTMSNDINDETDLIFELRRERPNNTTRTQEKKKERIVNIIISSPTITTTTTTKVRIEEREMF